MVMRQGSLAPTYPLPEDDESSPALTAYPPVISHPIGRVANTGYSSASDIKSIADYLRFLFGDQKGARCIVDYGNKSSDWPFRQHFLYDDQVNEKSLERFAGKDDIYIGMNLMLNKKRRNDNIKRLAALYVDIDCYKCDLTPEQALERIRTRFIFLKIPVPSAVVFSGRGLQLIWKIDEDPNAISRWKTAEKYLLEQLKDLGADPKATDPARVLRLPFTHNSKGGDAFVREINDVIYTIREILRGYNIQLPQKKTSGRKRKWGVATPKMRKTAIQLAKQLGVDPPNFECYEETFEFNKWGLEQVKNLPKPAAKKSHTSLSPHRTDVTTKGAAAMKFVLDARSEDLKTLATLRKGQNCGREVILFLVRLFVGEMTGDFEYALRVCEEINKTFEYPLGRNEVIKATASAERKLKEGETYNYRNSTIIELLGITPEEETHLHYFSSARLTMEKKEKDRTRKKKAYYENLEKSGTVPVQTKILEKAKALAELSAQGLSRDAICTELGISRASFYRYKKVAEALARENTQEQMSEATQEPQVEAKADHPTEEPAENKQQNNNPCTEIVNSVKVSYRRTLAPYAANMKDITKNTILKISPLYYLETHDSESAFLLVNTLVQVKREEKGIRGLIKHWNSLCPYAGARTNRAGKNTSVLPWCALPRGFPLWQGRCSGPPEKSTLPTRAASVMDGHIRVLLPIPDTRAGPSRVEVPSPNRLQLWADAV